MLLELDHGFESGCYDVAVIRLHEILEFYRAGHLFQVGFANSLNDQGVLFFGIISFEFGEE